MKIIVTLFLFISTLVSCSFAQDASQYTYAYLNKTKCKNCELKIYYAEGFKSHIRTYKVIDSSYTYWHGYNVIYYAEDKPKRVTYLYKDIKHGRYMEFYINRYIKVKGKYKKGLECGTWIYSDSLGNIEKKVKYRKGNDVSGKIKYNYYFAYGLPKFREEPYDSRRDSIRAKYHLKIRFIAGCTVNPYQERLARRHNRMVAINMFLIHGANWEKKMNAEIEKSRLL